MTCATPGFSLAVDGVTGLCPAGESYAAQQIANRRIPVVSCEGPCIRGEIARMAADLVANDDPRCARACHGEAFFVPHSAMSHWVREADRVLMIDGCFLQCHGRVLKNLVPAQRVIQVDAHRIHRKFSDGFAAANIPRDELALAARAVADAAVALVSAPVSRHGAAAV